MLQATDKAAAHVRLLDERHRAAGGVEQPQPVVLRAGTQQHLGHAEAHPARGAVRAHQGNRPSAAVSLPYTAR